MTYVVIAGLTCGRFAEVADFLRASHLPAVVSPDEMRLLHLGKFLDDSRKLSGTRQLSTALAGCGGSASAQGWVVCRWSGAGSLWLVMWPGATIAAGVVWAWYTSHRFSGVAESAPFWAAAGMHLWCAWYTPFQWDAQCVCALFFDRDLP